MSLRTVSRYVRRTHMYLALFLVPWMLMYALSSLVFNHAETVRSWFGGDPNRFEKVDELAYEAGFEPGTTPKEAARQILVDLGMDGPHLVRGTLDGPRLTIRRQSPYALRRVTYFPREGRITVERQVANLPSVLTRMHTRHGFEQDYAMARGWGLGVELTVMAMLFWIASGLWLWWEIGPARKWGAICAGTGVAILLVMLFAI